MELKTMQGAYHEAGHIVVAAVRGLTLRPDGLMVLSNGEGFCVYSTVPEESDNSRESVILSSFAGYFAAKRFCNEHSCLELLHFIPELTGDWQDARKIIQGMSDKYPSAPQRGLEKQSEHLVDQYWHVIQALATALLAKNEEPMRPLKDGTVWSYESGPVRFMDGEEAVEILAQHGIVSVCKPRASEMIRI